MPHPLHQHAPPLHLHQHAPPPPPTSACHTPSTYISILHLHQHATPPHLYQHAPPPSAHIHPSSSMPHLHLFTCPTPTSIHQAHLCTPHVQTYTSLCSSTCTCHRHTADPESRGGRSHSPARPIASSQEKDGLFLTFGLALQAVHTVHSLPVDTKEI